MHENDKIILENKYIVIYIYIYNLFITWYFCLKVNMLTIKVGY